MTTSNAPFQTVQGNVIQTALNAVGQKEVGKNEGAIARFSGAHNKEPWCAGFITNIYESAGYDAVFKGVPSELSVASVMNHGAKNEFSSTIGQESPGVGDVFSFTSKGGKAHSHIGMVTKVHADGSLDITQGNTSNAVKTITYDKSNLNGKPLSNTFLDADKMDAFLKKQGVDMPPIAAGMSGEQYQAVKANHTQKSDGAGMSPFASLFNPLPNTKQVSNQLQDQGAHRTYEQNMQQAPAGSMENMFAQLLFALILTASGKMDMISKTNQTEESRVDALKQIDEERATQKTYPVQDTSPGSSPPPPNTPTKAPSRETQSERWS